MIRLLPLHYSDTPFTFTAAPSAEVHTVTMSHQAPPATTGASTEAYPAPWFTITSTESSASYQWQIHPVEHGPLRYTLIELPSSGHGASTVEPENQHRIKAIYHNVGVGTSLVQPFSEGVLLLPANEKDMDADLEAAAVTSLMGLLWKCRGVQTVSLEVPAVKEDDPKRKSKKSKGLFRKSWNDVGEEDVIR